MFRDTNILIGILSRQKFIKHVIFYMIHATINNKNFHIKKKFIRTFLDSKDNTANPNRKKKGGKKYIRNLRNQEPRQSMISTLTRSHSTRWRESKGGRGEGKNYRAPGDRTTMANYRAKEIIIIMINNLPIVDGLRGDYPPLTLPSSLPTTPPHIPPYPRESCITHKAKDPPVISALHNNNDSRDNSSYILGGKSVSRGPGKQRREQR